MREFTMLNRNPFRKSVGFYEVVSAPTPPPQHGNTSNTRVNTQSSDSNTDAMDSKFSPPAKNISHDATRIVGFNIKDQVQENKKKYLTAKYGAHQMSLIKKRLGVEMWLFDELKKLYDTENDDHDCDLDLDEILDLDTDSERRDHILGKLTDVNKPPEVLDVFIDEVLKKAKTL